MSKTSINTAFIIAILVSLIAGFGYGYRSGINAQLTLDKAIAIAKAQFKCEMVVKQPFLTHQPVIVQRGLSNLYQMSKTLVATLKKRVLRRNTH